MSSSPEEIFIGPAESESSDYSVRSDIWPKELDEALIKYAESTGVLPGVLVSKVVRQYLEAQGIEFSPELDRYLEQQTQLEKARAALRNPGSAAVVASGMDGIDPKTIKNAFDP